MKQTRQGVRDLNDIKGKSVGKKLAPVPEGQFCNHPLEARKQFRGGDSMCTVCGEQFEWNGGNVS